jgi:hypothetical protein
MCICILYEILDKCKKMAASIFPPSLTTSLFVNTLTQPKIVFLPAVSTIGSGKMYFIKDICGNAGVSSIFLSTTGLDSFDYKFRPSTLYALMSTNYQSVLLAADGYLNWLVLQNYNTNFLQRAVGQIFNFTTFSAGNFNIAGNTTFVGNEARITTNGTGLAGSLYYNQKVNIQSFTTNFVMRFELTNADGGTFLIQNASSNALGSNGGGLGYQGIGTSVAIRLDTYASPSSGVFSTDVLSNGTAFNDLGASGNLNSVLGLTINTTWNLSNSVTYNGTTLSYTITNTANGSNFTSNATINIPSIVGADTAWVGFTGGTGGATELQFISFWNFGNF